MEFRIEKVEQICINLRLATDRTVFIDTRSANYDHMPEYAVYTTCSLSLVGNDRPVYREEFDDFENLVARANEIVIKHRRF